MQAFELRVISLCNNDYAIELGCRESKKAGETISPSAYPIGRIEGQSLILAKQAIYGVLKADNHDPRTLNSNRKAEYAISENSGVALAVLFEVLTPCLEDIEPITDVDLIVRVIVGISAMSYEETNYWFSLITNSDLNATQALRALFS